MDMCSSLPLCLHLPLLRLKQVPKPTPGMETMPMATMEGLVTSSACPTVSEPVCSTRNVTNYEKNHEQKCSSRPVEECKAVPREVPRE